MPLTLPKRKKRETFVCRKKQKVEAAVAPSSSSNSTSNGVIVPANAAYHLNLKFSKRFYESDNFSVVADCDSKTGHLLLTNVVLYKQRFFSLQNGGRKGFIYSCLCEEGLQQHQRLVATQSRLSEDFVDFLNRERKLHCIHASAVEQLFPSVLDVCRNLQEGTQDQPSVDHTDIYQLCANPLLVAVETGHAIHLLQFNRRSKSITCTCKVGSGRTCIHKKKYEEWRRQGNGQEGENECEQPRISSISFDSISKEPIPYPLPTNLQQVFMQYESCYRSFPSNLVPSIPENSKCACNEDWDESDPVEKGWHIGSAVIYKDSLSLTHKYDLNGQLQPIGVYYRRCKGPGGCKLFYDGQDDLLFNLNNKYIIYYGVLFNYLHHMLEGRNPLAACQRALNHNHEVLRGSKCIPIHILRRGWNSFARLLRVDWENTFICPSCGPHPETIICDGTSVGFPKRHLDVFENDEQTLSPPIHGTKQKDRVFIDSFKVRRLLAQYVKDDAPITPDEYNIIVEYTFTQPHLYSLHNVMVFLKGNLSCPSQYRLLLKNLSYNSPACAFVQGSSDGVAAVLQEMLLGRIDFFSSECHTELDFLHENFPVIASMMRPLCDEDGHIPDHVYSLLYDIVGRAGYLSTDTCTSNGQYPPVSKKTVEEMFEGLAFFPGLHQLHGSGTYSASVSNVRIRAPCRAEYDCTKISRGHPTLTPGIFTVYCEHGVCYGFQAMKQHESPAVPFEILKTRFPIAPRIVIYDNACHLHQYCLNREPSFFKETMFLVDRMHMRGHVGCCLGYNMDAYKRLDIKKINSQVNEQENAGLARIKGQLSYMLPINFMFHAALFLALRNKNKLKNLVERN